MFASLGDWKGKAVGYRAAFIELFSRARQISVGFEQWRRDALLCRASPALKSAIANLGAIVLSTHCEELEEFSKSGRITDAARRVKVIREDSMAPLRPVFPMPAAVVTSMMVPAVAEFRPTHGGDRADIFDY